MTVPPLPAWMREPGALFDLETTGTDPATARIVQIAVVPIDDGQPHDPWCRLVFPDGPIGRASEVHRITDEHVQDAPRFADVAAKIRARLEGRLLYGYNASTYDAPLLAAEFQRVGQPIEARAVVDVLVLVRHFDRYVKGEGRHRLAVTAARHGFTLRDAHDAVGDCRMTWAVLLSVISRYRWPDERATLEQFLRWQATTAEAQRRDFERWQARQPKKDPPG